MPPCQSKPIKCFTEANFKTSEAAVARDKMSFEVMRLQSNGNLYFRRITTKRDIPTLLWRRQIHLGTSVSIDGIA